MPPDRKPLARWVLERPTTLAAALAGALVMASGIFAVVEIRAALQAGFWVRHTLDVLNHIAVLRTSLFESETGQRGYLLTGSPAYLEPYSRARGEIGPTLDRVASLTADNPDQQTRVAELRPLVGSKLEEFAETIHTRDSEGLDAALRLVQTDAGSKIMERIQALLKAMRDEEAGLLRERLEARELHGRYAIFSTVSLAGVALLVFGSVMTSLNRAARGRLQAEAARWATEERLRVTLRSIGDGVIATGVSGEVVFMNPVAQALTGWRESDALGVPVDQVFRIVHEFTRDVVESPVSRVLRDGMVVGLANHTTLLARDGSERPIDDSGAPIRDGDGALMGVVLVFRDVTARRLSEEARERLLRTETARAAAEAANRAKDEFLAIVSHELRSPLNAAASWLELFRSGTLEEATKERALDTIERNLRLQAMLTGDLLDVSRIVSGKMTLERVPLDVSELVQAAVDEKVDLAEARHITLRYDRGGALVTSADPARLGQVLANLLSNAIKFTPDGGSVDVDVRERAGTIEISVRDTGRGISRDFLPHVFERFRQADSSLVRSHGGLGLGLSISKHIVEQHGGSIRAESDGEGHGAVFRVEIPFEEAWKVDGPRRVQERSRGSLAGLHILVVEDHADTREAMTHLLAARGATVAAAAEAPEALSRFDEQRPDVLLSDIGLPSESGFSLVREIRIRDKTAGTHTISLAITGFGRPEDRQEALHAGFDGYIQKPIDVDVLVDTIQKLQARIERG